MLLLPTASRAAVGRNLAYPVGAELISQAVHDVPFAAQIKISFEAQTTLRASQFNGILRDGAEYTVVRCWTYAEGTRYSGIFDNVFWQIVVYPVLRELKATARSALLAEGLPALKKYLLRTGPPKGENLHPLAIKFCPTEKRIYCPSTNS